mmetsp:Transcript_44972/g.140860  ORF Transcript_44972/g.140860 Transcript_44972/m.140860 type:complete len:239 (+) Transcript_44972:1980-2696(+)
MPACCSGLGTARSRRALAAARRFAEAAQSTSMHSWRVPGASRGHVASSHGAPHRDFSKSSILMMFFAASISLPKSVATCSCEDAFSAARGDPPLGLSAGFSMNATDARLSVRDADELRRKSGTSSSAPSSRPLSTVSRPTWNCWRSFSFGASVSCTARTSATNCVSTPRLDACARSSGTSSQCCDSSFRKSMSFTMTLRLCFRSLNCCLACTMAGCLPKPECSASFRRSAIFLLFMLS